MKMEEVMNEESNDSSFIPTTSPKAAEEVAVAGEAKASLSSTTETAAALTTASAESVAVDVAVDTKDDGRDESEDSVSAGAGTSTARTSNDDAKADSEERESAPESEVEEKKPSPPPAAPRAATASSSSSVATSTNNNTKKRAKNTNNNASKNNAINNNNNPNGPNGNNAYPYPRQPPWGPYAPPPPYGYPGSTGPYGPPPPPHYSHPGHHHPHHPPPPPHPHHMMPHPHYGGPPGSYGGPPPPHGGPGGSRNGGNNNNGAPNLGGPPPSYPPHPGHHPHPYAGGPPPPPYGMPYGMPPGYPPNMPPGINNNNSDNASVSSNKSKSSKTSLQRKRTIDGVVTQQNNNNDSSGMMGANLPASAYQFRQSDSNSSSTSTVTAGNNTSMESSHTGGGGGSLSHQHQLHANGMSDLTESPGRTRTRSGSVDLFYGNEDANVAHGHHGGHHQHSNQIQQQQQQQQQQHPGNPNNGNSRHHKSSRTGGYHRRDYSGASTASSLSVGGFSLSGYHEGPRVVGAIDDVLMSDALPKSSHKRHKSSDRGSLIVDTGMRLGSTGMHSADAEQSTRFEQLTMDDNRPTSTLSNSSGNDRQLFLSLSTSPINGHPADLPDVDATPISKNTAKIQKAHQDKIADNAKSAGIFKAMSGLGPSVKLENSSSEQDRASETPTPPAHGELGIHQTDEHEQSQLNHHLRHQSFTPLPHLSNSGDSTVGASPSNAGFPSGIAPQLSWSIAGDTPSLGDLADWEEDNKKQGDKVRPSSTTSAETQNMLISPQDFQMWKEEHDLAERGLSGTTTPLPFFMDQATGEGRENYMRMDQSRNMSQTSKKMGQQQQPFHHHQQHQHQQQQQQQQQHQQRHQQHQQQQQQQQQHHQHGDPSHIHSLFVNNSGARDQGIKSFNNPHNNMHPMWNKHDMPPTPLFASSEYREDGFTGRSPMDQDRRDMDFFAGSHMYGHPGHPGQHGHHPNDRVRNLRGRGPPGSHLPPMPLHIPPPMSSHLPMTSPMGLGKGMWSPHNLGMPPPMGSPHHMASPLNNMAMSKRKCVPLKPPIPSKFQGDIDKTAKSPVPEFTSLVNFPAHMSQKQTGNLPEGMRCCVMCGSGCPCSNGNKAKKETSNKGGNDHGLAPRSSNGQDLMGDKGGGYAIIPTQNKGLCTLCDVNVWVVVTTGLEIKWCKGCKNFRPWAAFGDKGLATKCLRCRERQREKYALQKEEKEKSRMMTKTKVSA